MEYTSAGVILFNMNSKVLIVQYPEGHWGFPKGYKETEDKSLFDTAKRELKEEIDILPNFFLNTNSYHFKECYGEKKIIYFIAFTINSNINLCHGLNSYKWVYIKDLDKFPGFLSKQIVRKLEELKLDNITIVKKVNLKDNIAKTNEKVEMPPSKHAYSRLVPLELINDNIKIENIPNTIDSYYLNNLLNRVNDHCSNECFFIDSDEISNCWSMVNILPALVWKVGKVFLPGKPSGCSIGERPMDLYLKIMKDFGFVITENNGGFYLEKGNVGISEITLPFPSFTGTSIAIYLAMLSNNTINIHNVSIEPEIIYLISVIKNLGYKIKFDKIARVIKFKGKTENNGVLSVRVPFDRNVLVTRMVSDLVSYGIFEWFNEEQHYLEELLLFLRKCGFEIYSDNYRIKIVAPNQVVIQERVVLNCGHFPKICSDWQPLLVILLCHYLISFELSDDIFENRFQIFSQLVHLNNNIVLNKKSSNKIVIDYCDTSEKFGIPAEMTTSTNLEFKLLNIRDAAAILIASHQSKLDIEFSNLLQFFRGYETLENVLGEKVELYSYEKQ
ncbi:NUDIX domain-containing protein [Streptococcus pneumoniae]|uniref:UDP-N-acetylglucosamine 1-carboxyvinyltransferase n=1 Tax=Streptococcus pneumoniae TaxID=1313 RepID=A0AAJ5P4A1_STREE|nr:NUDIX domain-containing protein [Streptococcus pneumoniae]MDA2874087.1 NUDIX domain-containing protein [Streptococcus pneumoniae]MDD0791849.1 NUDIX domain-containing protein [Streptococcus pneumoniae]MDD0796102.1 NUDIX domain-containing protein [Streptococcus pneumoniae]MDS2238341.1 NUDIX domain-containing protein [Streptococcus pneumoniae]MDS2282701.1 NUDIX domain-containing protein [Streptococcus pneumoniae]